MGVKGGERQKDRHREREGGLGEGGEHFGLIGLYE